MSEEAGKGIDQFQEAGPSEETARTSTSMPATRKAGFEILGRTYDKIVTACRLFLFL
jgi:hypothetical protein